MSIVGNRISARLTAMGKSQEWLGAQVGMRQQSIGAIVNGAVERPRKLKEIAQALETSQEYLLGETPDSAPFPHESQVLADYQRLSPAQREAVDAVIASFLKIE